MTGRVPVPPELVRSYLTPGEGIPGEARVEPEDFVVEEVPLYEPSGEGEHLYLLIEKRGITTEEAIRRLARNLGARRKEVGYAGRKDARAVTRQRISVFKVEAPEDLATIGDHQLKVLEAVPHKNKLKVGHLLGNRFKLRLRGSGPGEETARAVMSVLEQRGALNYFGLQRFGYNRNNHRLGRALALEDAEGFLELLLHGVRISVGEAPLPVEEGSPLARAREAAADRDYGAALAVFPSSMRPESAACRALAKGRDSAGAVRSVPGKQREFYVAAFQSLLFNTYLSRRIDKVDVVEQGEVATLHRNGAAFVVQDLAVDAPRCEAFEISPSGPLFGRRLLRPAEGSGPREEELAVLAELAGGLGAELTPAFGAKPLGSRRPLRIPVKETSVSREGDDLLVSFFLPKGCYATAVLEELFKRPVD